MFRNLISIGVSLALIMVLTCAACLGCFGPAPETSKAACCTEKSSCHREPAKKSAPHAHDDCQGMPSDAANGAPAPDIAKQITPAQLPSAHIEIAVPAIRAEVSYQSLHPYYPPDLCLLKSQFTI